MKNIAFRVDGGPTIGMGHLMRCLALATAFPDEVDIFFITKEEKSVEKLLQEYNINLITISSNLDYKEEIEKLKEIVIKYKLDTLITDSYQIDQNYLLELKKTVTKLISIHDFAPFVFPSDIMINGNIYAPSLDYHSLNGNTDFLLGTDYTLLREEFTNLSRQVIKDQVENILITFGGSDPLELTDRVLATLNQIDSNLIDQDKLHLDIVVGPGFSNLEKIIEEVQESKFEVALHFNITQISQLMLKSDLAISAGGSTLYELAATGTPAIVLLQADNQILAAQTMEEKGIIINLGFWDKTKEEKLVATLIDLMKKPKLRYQMSRKAQSLVDGQGIKRCVERILSDSVSNGCQ
ncbi:pseudaminic acid biosynthesis-associated protein PseG [Halobacteroides halobius DSM 5150]|uniref:Pseudaminic acid biosynthesis-associated protein PseG n=1 Tax=Halobacteroides halobius (strain ATCC 35273 / DSM 5150 / MD-1) TaxID=748449 RepID=L0KAS4_HALHC|nr:UDP-2,4-diacetamido-2,4,6-trideoxy-beta-L-altropyranose hydrolase [Halobacteroides halobius]AGB42116.1 pseudaminic acid biosynthesis-associated protein PseG [Halobacteroides halobius DSM 5150]